MFNSLKPEEFGAVGDGVTNDTSAFRALANEINRSDGGSVELRAGATYLVGAQVKTDGSSNRFGYHPEDIFSVSDCAHPVVIEGNGAELKVAPLLRYGNFNLLSGEPDEPVALPYVNRATGAVPYFGMMSFTGYSGKISVKNLVLNGNMLALRIGGRWGDTGWQLPADGLQFHSNTGGLLIEGVVSHSHPRDGIQFTHGSASAGGPRIDAAVVGCEFRDCGRQGVTIVGGVGYIFERCRLHRIARTDSAVASLPGAGIDIEAEGGAIVRDVVLRDCYLADTLGPALVADTGDSADISLTNCFVVGTRAYAIWPKKPGFKMHGGTVVGACAQVWGDMNPERAAHFYSVAFRDDPALSPTGEVFPGDGLPCLTPAGTDGNHLFDNCSFVMTAGLRSPIMNLSSRFHNLTLHTATSTPGSFRGTVTGHAQISHNASLGFGPTTFADSFSINGATYGPTLICGDAVPASGIGSVVRKAPISDRSGSLIGYIAIYDAVT